MNICTWCGHVTLVTEAYKIEGEGRQGGQGGGVCSIETARRREAQGRQG